MGQEANCEAVWNGRKCVGRALLESHELIFRGDFRLKIARREMTGVEAADGTLSITYPDGTAKFQLGPVAAKWADKILHPPSLMDKLGVKKGGTRFQIVGKVEREFRKQLEAAGAIESATPDLIFFVAADRQALASLPPLNAAALWIIYPKSVSSITEAEVLEAGRKANLVDSKVASFSETHTALKFTRPKKRT